MSSARRGLEALSAAPRATATMGGSERDHDDAARAAGTADAAGDARAATTAAATTTAGDAAGATGTTVAARDATASAAAARAAAEHRGRRIRAHASRDT